MIKTVGKAKNSLRKKKQQGLILRHVTLSMDSDNTQFEEVERKIQRSLPLTVANIPPTIETVFSYMRLNIENFLPFKEPINLRYYGNKASGDKYLHKKTVSLQYLANITKAIDFIKQLIPQVTALLYSPTAVVPQLATSNKNTYSGLIQSMLTPSKYLATEKKFFTNYLCHFLSYFENFYQSINYTLTLFPEIDYLQHVFKVSKSIIEIQLELLITLETLGVKDIENWPDDAYWFYFNKSTEVVACSIAKEKSLQLIPKKIKLQKTSARVKYSNERFEKFYKIIVFLATYQNIMERLSLAYSESITLNYLEQELDELASESYGPYYRASSHLRILHYSGQVRISTKKLEDLLAKKFNPISACILQYLDCDLSLCFMYLLNEFFSLGNFLSISSHIVGYYTENELFNDLEEQLNSLFPVETAYCIWEYVDNILDRLLDISKLLKNIDRDYYLQVNFPCILFFERYIGELVATTQHVLLILERHLSNTDYDFNTIQYILNVQLKLLDYQIELLNYLKEHHCNALKIWHVRNKKNEILKYIYDISQENNLKFSVLHDLDTTAILNNQTNLRNLLEGIILDRLITKNMPKQIEDDSYKSLSVFGRQFKIAASIAIEPTTKASPPKTKVKKKKLSRAKKVLSKKPSAVVPAIVTEKPTIAHTPADPLMIEYKALETSIQYLWQNHNELPDYYVMYMRLNNLKAKVYEMAPYEKGLGIGIQTETLLAEYCQIYGNHLLLHNEGALNQQILNCFEASLYHYKLTAEHLKNVDDSELNNTIRYFVSEKIIQQSQSLKKIQEPYDKRNQEIENQLAKLAKGLEYYKVSLTTTQKKPRKILADGSVKLSKKTIKRKQLIAEQAVIQKKSNQLQTLVNKHEAYLTVLNAQASKNFYSNSSSSSSSNSSSISGRICYDNKTFSVLRRNPTRSTSTTDSTPPLLAINNLLK